MTDPILLHEDLGGGVSRLTLNTPQNLNALSDAMLAALLNAFGGIAQDSSTKTVILRGAGKVFCAGHDLKEMQAGRAAADKGAAYFADLFARCGEVMKAITTLPQPVIAQAHGIATAAGCQLVATCDMAATGTRFGVNIGLFCSTPMVALTRNVGPKQAFEMLVTGDFIDTARARDIGLINRIALPEALDAETLALARIVASKLGTAVRIGKRAFYDQAQMSLADAYAHTGAVMVENMLQPDTDEGIKAFLEKRTPDWPA
jgi:enoyl-CoA hydratase/carnithine racemase